VIQLSFIEWLRGFFDGKQDESFAIGVDRCAGRGCRSADLD
jgi:hypothetical protein